MEPVHYLLLWLRIICGEYAAKYLLKEIIIKPMLIRRRGETLHLRLLDVCEERGGLQSSAGIGVLLFYVCSPAPLQRHLQLRVSYNEELLLVW